MRFEDPEYLYLLILLPILVAAHIITNIIQSKRYKRFGQPQTVNRLVNAPRHSISVRREIKFCLLALSLACVIFMLARPQLLGPAQQNTDNRQGIEMLVCLDVSNSMLAEDVAPSRMDKCKMMLEDLIDKFSNDKIGLIVFAGDAFIQLPLTADYVSAKMFLQNISPGMINTQGTDISRAIDIATHSFSNQEGIGRAIVVITDGEDHEGGAADMAKSARKSGIKTYVLGVGSTKGTPIPYNGSYLTDKNGETVMTQLNEAMCKEIAAAGGGKYIHVDNTNIAKQRLSQAMTSLARQEIETSVYTERSEQFQAFALIAFILLIIEICVQEKRVILRRLHLFGFSSSKAALFLFFVLMAIGSAKAQDKQQPTAETYNSAARSFIRQGNRDYRAKRFDKAEVAYRKALEANPASGIANYNLGNALLMQNKDSLAVVQYNKALETETDPMRQARIFHNIGVVCQTQKDFAQAIEAYKQSLRRNPSDDQTRYNLVLCQKQLKKNQNNQNKNQNKDQNKDKNKDQNKDKNKDNKDQNKDKNQDKDKNKQQQDKGNQKDQPQQPRSQEGQMSDANAEQLLNAAKQQEKATQDKLKAVRGSRRQLEKNW